MQTTCPEIIKAADISCKSQEEAREIMCFFEKHYEYINACATARAFEIASVTKRYDIEDYKQEMFLYVIQHIDRYQPERSRPHTFINLLISSKKKMIFRSMSRNKNRIISQARELEYAR
jgi:DNA-directed RNA polymerase specialized sigma24 family protein